MKAGDLIEFKKNVLEIREAKKDGYKCTLCFALNKKRTCQHLPVCWKNGIEFYFVKLNSFEIRKASKAGKNAIDYKGYESKI